MAERARGRLRARPTYPVVRPAAAADVMGTLLARRARTGQGRGCWPVECASNWWGCRHVDRMIVGCAPRLRFRPWRWRRRRRHAQRRPRLVVARREAGRAAGPIRDRRAAARSSSRPGPAAGGSWGSPRPPATARRRCSPNGPRPRTDPSAWVSLDRFDDDAAALLFVMASAFVALWPTEDDLLADMRGVGVSVLGRAAPRLASAFRASPEPFVLMLDDLHELRPRTATTRWAWSWPACPTARSWSPPADTSSPTCPACGPGRGAGDRGRGPGPRRGRGPADLLGRRGRPHARAGPHGHRAHRGLAGRPLPGGDDRAGTAPTTALTISGDDRFIADYLYRESLARQPEDVQDFLRRTSVLDQLSGPLCDAVLGGSTRRATSGTSRPPTSSSCRSTGGASGTATTPSSASSSPASSAASSPT